MIYLYPIHAREPPFLDCGRLFAREIAEQYNGNLEEVRKNLHFVGRHDPISIEA